MANGILGMGLGPQIASALQAPLGGATDWLKANPYTALMLGMGLLSGNGTRDAFGKGMQGLLAGSEYDDQRNTKSSQAKALSSYFDQNKDALPPGTKDLYSAFPTQAVAQIFGNAGVGTSTDINNYKFYANEEMKAGRQPVSFRDWQRENQGASGAQESFYGNPIYTTDKDGNIVGANIFSNRGNVKPLGLPGGGIAAGGDGVGQTYIQPPGSAKAVNLGTSQAIISPTGRVQGTLPVDVSGEASQKAVGAASGAIQINLPTIENTAQRVQAALDDLIADPEVESLIGYYEPLGIPKEGAPGLTPEMRKSQERARSKIDNILGNVFLTAYNDLRGAGAITEQEGAAAKAAYTRLQNKRMAYSDYIAAAKQLKTEFDKLIGVARAKAGMGGAPAAAPQGKTITLPDGTVMKQIN